VWLIDTEWLGPNQPDRGRVDILASKAIVNAVRDNGIGMYYYPGGLDLELISEPPIIN